MSKNYIYNPDVEIGYQYFIRLFSNFQIMMVVMYFITIIIEFKIFKKYTGYTLLPIIFTFKSFLIDKQMIQYRNYIAIIILYISIQYILKKKIKSFLFIVLIASLFHISSILFLIIYPLYNMMDKKNIEKSIILILIGLFIYFFIDLKFFLSEIGSINEKVYLYLNSEELGKGYKFSIMMIINLLIYLFAILFRKNIGEEDKRKYELFILMYSIGILFQYSFTFSTNLSLRLSSIYFFSEPFLIALIIKWTKHKLFYFTMFGFIMFGQYLRRSIAQQEKNKIIRFG